MGWLWWNCLAAVQLLVLGTSKSCAVWTLWLKCAVALTGWLMKLVIFTGEERGLLPWCLLKAYMIWLQIAWILLKLARSLHWHTAPAGSVAEPSLRKPFQNFICKQKCTHGDTCSHSWVRIHVNAKNHELIYCTPTSDYCSRALQLKRLHLDSMNHNFSITTVL